MLKCLTGFLGTARTDVIRVLQQIVENDDCILYDSKSIFRTQLMRKVDAIDVPGKLREIVLCLATTKIRRTLTLLVCKGSNRSKR